MQQPNTSKFPLGNSFNKAGAFDYLYGLNANSDTMNVKQSTAKKSYASGFDRFVPVYKANLNDPSRITEIMNEQKVRVLHKEEINQNTKSIPSLIKQTNDNSKTTSIVPPLDNNNNNNNTKMKESQLGQGHQVSMSNAPPSGNARTRIITYPNVKVVDEHPWPSTTIMNQLRQ